MTPSSGIQIIGIGRQVEAASRGREADTQEDRQSRADGLRQPQRNREAEAENGRQSTMPVWVEVGRFRQVSWEAYRGSGRHFGDRQESPTGRLGQRQAEAGMHTEGSG
jgi:hypothetical protein